ncbi:MAG: membrane protein insertion efficiency factor YidD [Chlamydiae bacterium]|nr:membrane protein insertion efficiency factor YidD [Chlamydiota bacterium]
MCKFFCRFLIQGYQLLLSPFFGSCCRFYPSCSEYALEALYKHSLGKAVFLIIKRIAKCNPWCKGGVDFP